MSEIADSPVPYRVIYSGIVRDGLNKLVARAKEHGLGPQMLAAIQKVDSRLRTYPQFGQPLRDLKMKPSQIWIGVVAPLVVHYVLDEQRRHVMVLTPLMLLPRSGF